MVMLIFYLVVGPQMKRRVVYEFPSSFLVQPINLLGCDLKLGTTVTLVGINDTISTNTEPGIFYEDRTSYNQSEQRIMEIARILYGHKSHRWLHGVDYMTDFLAEKKSIKGLLVA